MSHVTEINDIESLESYRLVWNALHKQTRQATFFQTLDWLKTFWKHFGRDFQLRVLVVHSGGQTIGIVPLVVMRERTRVGIVRVLTYPLHDWGTFYGPIGPHPTATLMAAMNYLSAGPRDWDLLDLRWVDKDDVDRQRTPNSMRIAGLSVNPQPWRQAAIVEFAGSWEDYWGSRSGKFRNNVRRGEKRLAALGEVRRIRYRPQGAAHDDADPRWDLYDACVQLAQASWQGSSTTGTTLSHESVSGFFRDCHEAAARNGMLDMNMIYVGDSLVAFGYNYHCAGHVTGMRIGHDPSLKACSLGLVLYATTFKESCRLGDHSFDLGVGFLDVKKPWLTRVVTSYRYTHYRPTGARAQLLRLKHRLRKAAG